jgi:hypothetical protein
MVVRKWLVLSAIAAVVIGSGVHISWSQETPAAADKAGMESEPQWLWGEVVAVNTQAKTIQVKYLDYDTDIEKELVLTVDAKTKYENAKGLEEVKQQDTISVDYLAGTDGVNLALAISLEKLEDMDAALDDIEEPARERVGSMSEKQAAPVVEAGTAAAVPSEGKQ